MIHIHVDVDDFWIYANAYGIEAGSIEGSVYTEAMPRFLMLLDEAKVKATFFVVGNDLRNDAARAFCRDAVDAGHEIANHSLSHPIAFHSLTFNEAECEILRADEAISDAIGVKPVGFRSPGYFLDGSIVDVLTANGYLYDSSILPTFLHPLFSLYLWLRSGYETDKRFGTRRSPFASQRLQRVRGSARDGADLLELPISVLPILRLPIHSTFSFHFPAFVRRMVYAELRRRANAVLLFHAVDAADVESAELRRAVLPLRLPLAARIETLRQAFAATREPAATTTRAHLERIDPSSVPESRVLRWG